MNITTSPLVQGAAEAKRSTRWWLAWIIAVAIVRFTSAVGETVWDSMTGDPDAQWGEVVPYVFTVILLGLWVLLKEGRPFSSLGFRGTRGIGRFLLGAMIGAA